MFNLHGYVCLNIHKWFPHNTEGAPWGQNAQLNTQLWF